MKSFFECKRCFYTCKQKNDMIKHINKKKKCNRKIESFNYADNDLSDLSLIRIYREAEEEHEKYVCKKCEIPFTHKKTYLEHVFHNCKLHSFSKGTNTSFYEQKCDTQNNYTFIENNSSVINNNNNYYNINITIPPRSFDDEWDDTEIDDKFKAILLLTQNKFTYTLEELLNNDVNLNVILDTTGDTGMIYKKDEFKSMKIHDIVNISMDKLYNHLNKFYKDVKDNNVYNIKEQYLNDEKKDIDEKYKQYKINKETKNAVIHYIKNIYNKKKEHTIKRCNTIINNMHQGF